MGTQECIEQKVPLTAAGRLDEDAFRDFCEDLKLLHSLRGCAGVVRSFGVIFLETGRQLKRYLYESPLFGSLPRLLNIVPNPKQYHGRSEKLGRSRSLKLYQGSMKKIRLLASLASTTSGLRQTERPF